MKIIKEQEAAEATLKSCGPKRFCQAGQEKSITLNASLTILHQSILTASQN